MLSMKGNVEFKKILTAIRNFVLVAANFKRIQVEDSINFERELLHGNVR